MALRTPDDYSSAVPITPAVVSSEQQVANAFTAAGLIPVRVNFSQFVDTAFNSTVSSRAAARNFGLDDVAEHGERYRRAAEFTDVSIALRDSWEDGAEVGDKAAGVYADPSRIHPVDFAEKYFRVRGPLNVPRSPQGRPLLVQAGSSQDGRDFAARYAEAVFTAQQTWPRRSRSTPT